MSAQHTPGPWEVVEVPHTGLIGVKRGEHVLNLDGDKEADAHLIAAAPELLELLESLINNGLSPLWLKRAKVTMAKARGAGMKRETFEIVCSDGRKATAYAWNSAKKLMGCMVKDSAIAHGCDFYRTVTELRQDENSRHVTGAFGWVGQNGISLIFNITRGRA